MIEHLSEARKAFSLVVSVKKTIIVTQDGITKGNFMLDNKPLEIGKKFCHLGSAVSSTTSLDDEMCVRIGKAATAFGRLRCEHLVVPCSLA